MSTFVTYTHKNGPANIRFRDFATSVPSWAADVQPDGDDLNKSSAGVVSGGMTAQEVKEFEEDIARGAVPWYRKE